MAYANDMPLPFVEMASTASQPFDAESPLDIVLSSRFVGCKDGEEYVSFFV